jgi:hypothetical protein
MFYRCQRFTTNQYKSKERVQTKGAKLNRRQPWSGAPDWCTMESNSKLASLGNSGSRSTIIHQTIRCSTGLSGVPAEQRLLHANGRLQNTFNALQCAPESEQRQKAHRIVYSDCPVQHRTVQWPRRQKLQRSNPNGRVTWLAHRTVSGGAPDCPVRHSTAASTKRLVWWLGL